MAHLNSAWTAENAEAGSEPQLADLERLERHLVDRVMRLFEGLMRMAVTRSCPAYDPAVVDDRLGSVIELAEIIRERRQL